MVENKAIPIGLISLAAIVALVALIAPWWAGDYSAGGFSMDEQAGPFASGNDMISSTSAVVSGVLTLVALLCLAAAAALLVYSLATGSQDNMTRYAPLLALGGGVVILVALVLAIFMYPSEGDMGFWDSESTQEFSIATYAAWGWYMGMVASVAAIVGAALALTMRDEQPSSAMGEGSGDQTD